MTEIRSARGLAPLASLEYGRRHDAALEDGQDRPLRRRDDDEWPRYPCITAILDRCIRQNDRDIHPV